MKKNSKYVRLFLEQIVQKPSKMIKVGVQRGNGT